VTPAAPRHPALFAAGLTLLTLATCVALLVGQGNPAFALAPALAAACVWGVWKAPLRIPVLVLLFLALTVDMPNEQPAMGEWSSPLAPIGRALFGQLSDLTGVRALRFAGMDLLVAALFGLVLYRKATKSTVDQADGAPTASCLGPALVGAFLALLFMWGWGVVLRGGDFRNSLWQMRQMAYMPVLAFLFHAAFRGPSDHRLLGAMTLFAACLKVAFGLWVYETVFRPQGVKPAFTNTHSDSMLFATAVIIVLARWNERRDTRGWLLLLLLPWLGAGMYVNNRRIVYVAIAVALMALYFIIPWGAVKRAVTRAMLLGLPLIPLYIGVGWNSGAKIFKPVQTLRSVVAGGSDRSTATRDIENYNLHVTLKTNPLLGTGFGHEYIEFVQADDISSIFPQYRYIPHNALLGLLAFGGMFGFTLVWMPLLVGMFLAVRSYRHAQRPVDRTAALTVVAVIIVFVNQAYGDMGLQSWLGTFLVAASLTVAGKMAVAVGAWPKHAAAPRRSAFSPAVLPPPELSA
jgi:hypothetical protein